MEVAGRFGLGGYVEVGYDHGAYVKLQSNLIVKAVKFKVASASSHKIRTIMKGEICTLGMVVFIAGLVLDLQVYE